MTITDFLYKQQSWLLEQNYLEAWGKFVEANRQEMFLRIPGNLPGAVPIENEPDEDDANMGVCDGVATINIKGPMLQNPSPILKILFGLVDINKIESQVKSLITNNDVQLVFLDMNTPGGSAQGTPEVAQAIRALAKVKPVYTTVKGSCCSGGYWLASQTDGIFLTPSSKCGSIGVISSFVDSSNAYKAAGLKQEVFTSGQYKGMGQPGTSLTDSQRILWQEQVDEIFGEFKNAVLDRGRKIPDSAMQGQTFSAKKGQENNLCFMVDDMDATVQSIIRRTVK